MKLGGAFLNVIIFFESLFLIDFVVICFTPMDLGLVMENKFFSEHLLIFLV